MNTERYEYLAAWHYECMRGMVRGSLRRVLLAVVLLGVIGSVTFTGASHVTVLLTSAIRTAAHQHVHHRPDHRRTAHKRRRHTREHRARARTHPAKRTHPVKPMHTVKHTHPAKHVRTAKHTHLAKHASGAKSTRSAKHVRSVKHAHLVERASVAKSTRSVKHPGVGRDSRHGHVTRAHGGNLHGKGRPGGKRQHVRLHAQTGHAGKRLAGKGAAGKPATGKRAAEGRAAEGRAAGKRAAGKRAADKPPVGKRPVRSVVARKRVTAAAFPQNLLIAAPAGPAPAAQLSFLRTQIVQALITRPTRKDPWTVRIPSIGVNARLIVLGSPDNEYLPVPSLAEAFRVGWYDFTSVPGQPGNVVLVGHVDTYLGPAVFYNLYMLRPGNPIEVMLGKHHYARYFVRSVRELPKADFPTMQIFSDTRARQLWVITCGGDFDYATHHYLDNIIVSASQ
jgi:Sortase domain